MLHSKELFLSFQTTVNLTFWWALCCSVFDFISVVNFFRRFIVFINEIASFLLTCQFLCKVENKITTQWQNYETLKQLHIKILILSNMNPTQKY